jgi:hypothetical protein
MHCYDCQRAIPHGQKIETTRSEQTNSPGHLGAATSTELVIICPDCSRRRAQWGWVAGLVVAAFVLGGISIIVGAIVNCWRG